MSNFYQKPAIRFAESPLESAMGSTVCRVYVGVACVGVDLPEMGVPVWLYQPGRGIWIGGRGEVNAEEGWLWGNSHGDCSSTASQDGLLWHSHTLEVDDDYQPTHWMLLPQPPSGENA